MKLRKWTAAALVVSLSAGFALADEIADRQAIMKNNGRAIGQLGAILKGEKPFDQTVVDAALKTLADDAQKFDVKLFPETSKTGGDTEASPKIWEDAAGFKTKISDFTAVVTEAKAKIKDADSLKTVFPTIGKACGGCHETFRVKNS